MEHHEPTVVREPSRIPVYPQETEHHHIPVSDTLLKIGNPVGDGCERALAQLGHLRGDCLHPPHGVGFPPRKLHYKKGIALEVRQTQSTPRHKIIDSNPLHKIPMPRKRIAGCGELVFLVVFGQQHEEVKEGEAAAPDSTCTSSSYFMFGIFCGCPGQAGFHLSHILMVIIFEDIFNRCLSFHCYSFVYYYFLIFFSQNNKVICKGLTSRHPWTLD